jgi:hypothetical protein
MNIIYNVVRGTPVAASIIALAFSSIVNASPRALSFNATPVSDAVAQIDHELGIHIALKSGIDPNTLVTFRVDDLGTSGAQLDAVNNLANALLADYEKTFVVSKVISESAVVSPNIDSNGQVVFPKTTLPAEDAIEMVAAADNAKVRFYTPIHGTVTMSADHLSASDAAMEIAQQTHTQWKAYFGLTRRGSDRAGGTIIGYTSGGRPILELPLLSFERPTPEPTPPADTTASTATTPPAPGTAAAGTPNANQPGTGMYPNGYGYASYGYPGYTYGYANPYGYGNPYAFQPPFGYGSSFGGYGSGSVVIGGNGVSSMGGNPYGYGAPIVFGP